ncbi:MAG: tRNA (adenosine(37)-N6)-threonylcarbamoyltransferase complex ATPase subunit type 1 TsaE [Hyphomicrobiales bacterium]|nr:tRNA (adenosine(37)-N6)-threonylcarbamoyltransferase complex ATPase subunit type 1 TsaE [Hyphomicrobiales bacterium]
MLDREDTALTGPTPLGDMALLARVAAAVLRPGDTLALSGEIGAGKTTFARFLIRALAADDALETPSPAYSLQQVYDTPRGRVSHFDFYRLSPGEADALGLAETLEHDISIIEWPERAGGQIAAGFRIALAETDDPDARALAVSGPGARGRPAARLVAMAALLRDAGWGDARVTPLTPDASARVYYRLRRGDETALLMDWPAHPDGPPIRGGLPYSRIARLAENVGDFIRMAGVLASLGVCSPRIIAADEAAGLLLVEDFGDGVFQTLVGAGAEMAPLWRVAVDALIGLRGAGAPAADAAPPYDRNALAIETELLIDWCAPAASGRPLDPAARQEFAQLWGEQFDWLLAQTQETGVVLRDFHSPNLILLSDGGLGVIDFQDALMGHRAYDLVSVLQDARVDVPTALESELYDRYEASAAVEPSFDAEAFRRAYATLGAQRASKILGIFVRLDRRDGKPGYLRHLPRVRRHLARNLAHPALARLKAWHERHMPDLFDEERP